MSGGDRERASQRVERVEVIERWVGRRLAVDSIVWLDGGRNLRTARGMT